MSLCNLEHLVSWVGVVHHLGVQYMELSKIKVVVIGVQELVCILFIHAWATKPDSTITSLDRGFSHVKVTEWQVVVKLFLLVFGGIISNKFDLRLFIERPWRQKPISPLDFSLDKWLVHIIHISKFGPIHLNFLLRVRESKRLDFKRVRSLGPYLFLGLSLVLIN